MKFMDGLSIGLLGSGVAFWIYLICIQLLKNPNFKVLAFVFVAIETIITLLGIGIGIYAMWKYNK